MGWTVLYIAFGVVALWLLGEVLLQYNCLLYTSPSPRDS